MELDINMILGFMRNYQGLIFPHRAHPFSVFFRERERPDPRTEEEWDAIQWNPSPGNLSEATRAGFEHLAEFDPSASPKPTWNELVIANRNYIIHEGRNDILRRTPRVLDPAVDRRANAPVEIEGLGPVYIGGGIDHLTSLLHSKASFGEPGYENPFAILRHNEEHEVIYLRTQGEYTELLDKVAIKTNEAESSKNVVQVKINKALGIADGSIPLTDPEGNLITDELILLEKREEALAKAQDILDNIDTELDLALQEMVIDQPLPTEPARARVVFLQQVELAATAKTQFLRGVFGQQGMDVSVPTCDNQAKAIQRVNQRRDLANRELCREEIISQMQTIRDRAIREIEAIKVIGSPLWRTDKNKDLTLNSDGNVEIAIPIRHGTQPSVRYLAINPPNAAQGSSNQVGIDPVARPAGWTLVSMPVADNENAHSLKLTWGGVGTAAAETIFDLVARNACGPTLLRVIIRNTEA